MALLMIEGFDTYATGNYLDKWDNQTGVVQAGGRKGTNCFWHWDAMNMSTSFGNFETIIVGVAMKLGGLENWDLFALRAGGTTHMQLITDAANQILVQRGSSTIGYTGYTLAPNIWHYVEFKAYIHDTAGYYEVRVNGVSIDSQSGIDTWDNFGPQYVNNVYFEMKGPGSGKWLDDIYIFNDEGSFCNDFVGDVHVEALFPDGAGYVSDWVAVPGAGANYEEVDETDPDGDTTFVVTSGVGVEDSYEFSDLVTLSGLIFAVQVNLWGKKDDVGSRTVVGTATPVSTTYSGLGISLGDTYGYTTYQFEANPETATYWTISEVNASEFGIRQEA